MTLPNTNTGTRYFYTDPLAAAWMAKHFGMKLRVDADSNGGYMIDAGARFIDCGDTFRELWERDFSSLGKMYVHPDSLHLLDPQLGDIITVNDPAIDYHGYCFRPDIIYRTYIDGSYGTDEFACTKSADVRVSQRHCGDLIAFHWPDQEVV